MASSQRKRLEGAMNKLAGVAKNSEQNTSHLSAFEINQPTKYIPIESVARSPYQPRLHLDNVHITALAESIRTSTLSNPIIVRVIGDDRYELIAGENRLEAVKLLGESEILAVIRRIDDRTAWLLSVADNLARKDLTDYEQGVAFQRMIDAKIVGSVKELSEHLGVNRTHIHSCLAFSSFPAAARKILAEDPSLIGARLALELKEYCLNDDHHIVVLQAIEMVRDKKLMQANVAMWIKRQLATKLQPENDHICFETRKFFSKNGTIKATVRNEKTGLSCRFNFDLCDVALEKIEEAIQNAINTIEKQC